MTYMFTVGVIILVLMKCDVHFIIVMCKTRFNSQTRSWNKKYLMLNYPIIVLAEPTFRVLTWLLIEIFKNAINEVPIYILIC